MRTVEYNGELLNYRIEKKRRKTISIRVMESCEVEVSAPDFVRDEEIEEILIKRWDWIKEVSNKRREIRNIKTLAEGDRLNFLGYDYPLMFIKWNRRETGVEFKEETFYVFIDGDVETAKKDGQINAALRNWYMQRARKVFKERVIIYSEAMRLYPQSIRVKGQKSLWGSCSFQNNLNFNYKLLLAPLQILDYVVVHELAHIRHKNHSNEFWKLVEEYIPDFREKREWLKRNGHTLEILEEQV